MSRRHRIVYVLRFLRSLQNALPVIAFFLISFGIVYHVFGIQYTCVVSVVTVFFQTRHKSSNNPPHRYIRLLVVGSVLILLAYVSSRALLPCILLNLTIPFVLVFTQSSQFNPKGYFSYAMIFVFLSLMPPDNLEELVTELLVFFLCVLIMALSIYLYTHFVSRPSASTFQLERGLEEMGDMILMLARPEDQKKLEKRFMRLTQEFHKSSYHQRFFTVQSQKNQLYDMYSTLLQRFSYLLVDEEWRSELDLTRIHALEHMSRFLKKAAAAQSPSKKQEGIDKARYMLAHMTLPEGRVRIFCRSLLHMMILILDTGSRPEEPVHYLTRGGVRDMIHQIRLRLNLESFEMRFAMRLSLVMTLSCVASFLLSATKSYWIPLNAFLLIQPSYEDSSYRMKTRPIGTLIGCCVEFLIHPLLPGMGGQICFALIMISLMYCATPGTWNQPIFSTCYALTLTSMTMDGTTAITLRILYLAAAVAIVSGVNRFFFPMRRDTQFRYNVKALFRLHNDYWNIIRQGLTGDAPLMLSSEILTYFHMIYQECTQYLKKHKDLPFRDDLQTVLIRLWHMFSELEQLNFLVGTRSIRREEHQALIRLIDSVQEDLYPIIACDRFPELKKELHYQEPEVMYVLKHYLMYAESLLDYKACIPF